MKILTFRAGPSGAAAHCPEATRLGNVRYLGYEPVEGGIRESEEPTRFALLSGAAGVEDEQFLRKQLAQGHIVPGDLETALHFGLTGYV